MLLLADRSIQGYSPNFQEYISSWAGWSPGSIASEAVSLFPFYAPWFTEHSEKLYWFTPSDPILAEKVMTSPYGSRPLPGSMARAKHRLLFVQTKRFFRIVNALIVSHASLAYCMADRTSASMLRSREMTTVILSIV